MKTNLTGYMSCLLLTAVCVGTSKGQLSPNHTWNFDKVAVTANQSEQSTGVRMDSAIAFPASVPALAIRMFILPAASDPVVSIMKTVQDSLAFQSNISMANPSLTPSAALRRQVNSSPGRTVGKIALIDSTGKLVIDQNQLTMDVKGILRSINQSDSTPILFYIPASHFKKMVMTYETAPAGSPSHQVFSQTADGGLTWKTSGLAASAGQSGAIPWSLISFDFGSDESLSAGSSPAVYRISFNPVRQSPASFSGAQNSAVTGLAIAPGQEAYKLYPNPAADLLHIACSADGVKTFKVYNVMGQLVEVFENNQKNFTIDVSTFAAGYYYLNICNPLNGTSSSLGFAKR